MTELEKILDKLEDIKSLLILSLISSGVEASEIGKALGVTGQSITNKFSVRSIRKK